jgi:endoglucanase
MFRRAQDRAREMLPAVDRVLPLAAAFAAAPLIAVSVTSAGASANGANPVAEARLWVDTGSQAHQVASSWARSRPADAALLRRIADAPQAVWYGDWNRNVRNDVASAVGAAARQGSIPVLVAYNIPARDCGSYSAGGAASADAYRRWIRDFAAGIGRHRAVVILEPDALAGMDCMPRAQQDQRVTLIGEAVRTLKSAGATVYLDAGHGRWIGAEPMAERLRRAGIAQADGFALNVSNFHPTAVNVAYGEQLSRLTGGKHFVIDTSRNGMGNVTPEQWCNPAGQALGEMPTTRTGHPLVDAYLWIKRPGESDGTCGGGPRAGEFWGEYALGLAQRQPTQLAMAR